MHTEINDGEGRRKYMEQLRNNPEGKPVRENKMGTMPVKKLIVNMSLPMMASMLVQALYNIVDSIFVSQVSEAALTAVTLAFPLQNLIISVMAGTGVGVNAMLSRALGEKNFRDSDSAANMGLFVTIMSAIVIMLLGIFVSGPFIRSQTQDEEIVELGITYLRICMTLDLGVCFQVMFERLLQSTGLTFYSMISQMTGAVINIIFDPIMIFGLFGFPEMGVAGAAFATVLGQTIAACIGLFMNLKFNRELHFSLPGIFHPNGRTIKRIYFVAVPTILMMSIGSVMTYLVDLILIAFSTTATAVFGVYFKLQSFFFMPVFGLNNGLVPILAYNYGAAQKKRIDEALRFAVCLALCIMFCGTAVFELFPAKLLGLFNASDTMVQIGIPALRTIALHFPIAACSIVLGSVFQAFGQSIYSLIVSACRQLVVLIPAAYLLSLSGNVNLVWWSFLIAEFMSLLLTLLFFRRIYRNVVVPMGKTEEA